MLVLICCNYDGDTYALFNKIETAKDEFDTECANSMNHRVLLVKPEQIGQSFGFGSRGEVFGAEIIFEFDREDEDGDNPVCGACGGDATLCDGC